MSEGLHPLLRHLRDLGAAAVTIPALLSVDGQVLWNESQKLQGGKQD